jgi:hypothetical protein
MAKAFLVPLSRLQDPIHLFLPKPKHHVVSLTTALHRAIFRLRFLLFPLFDILQLSDLFNGCRCLRLTPKRRRKGDL